MKLAFAFFSLFVCSLLSRAAQQITLSNVTAAKAVYGDANCLAVKFDVLLQQSYSDMIKSGDSAEQYVVELRVKDAAGRVITTNKGYGAYTGTDGALTAGYNIMLNYDTRLYAGQTIYIPFGAMNITEGPQDLTPVLRVTDTKGHVLVYNFQGPTATYEVPQRIHLNLAVKEIDVAETNAKNQHWDYKLKDEEDGEKPEVCWAIMLGNKRLSLSPFRSNSYTYIDTAGRNDFEFVISKGDLFLINVLDYDIASYSDKIGFMKVDMADMQKFSGSSFTSRFGKVLKMDFVVTIL